MYNREFIILVFSLENTLEDIELKNITLNFSKCDEHDFILNKSEIIAIDSLKVGETKLLYVKLLSDKTIRYPSISFNASFYFDVQDLDSKGNPHGNTYKDSYTVEKKVDVDFYDYLKPMEGLTEDSFKSTWSLYEQTCNLSDRSFKLPYPNVKKACQEISRILGINPLNSIENLDKQAQQFQMIFAHTSCYNTNVSIFSYIYIYIY